MTEDNHAYLRALEIEQFRIFEYLSLDLPPEGLLIVGQNGTGKSSIVDAILLLSTTRSRRGVQDADLIRFTSGVELGVAPYARVRGEVRRHDLQARIEIYLERPPDRPSTKKLIRVGDTPRRAVDVVGLLQTVAFAPDDLELVSGSPSRRRRFLDIVMSQVDNVYLRHLSRFQRMLSQRNGLLKNGDGRRDSGQFQFWDEQVVALGSYLMARRLQAVQLLNATATTYFDLLAPKAGQFSIAYRASLERTEEWWKAVSEMFHDESSVSIIESVSQRIAQAYDQAIDSNFHEDLARGSTQVGPHRDDLELRLDGRDISRFGSRGQQRLAVVALKLGEIDLMARLTGIRPMFLLDDVLSELDPRHREALLDTVKDGASQLVVTATEQSLVESPALDRLEMLRLVEPGQAVPGRS